MSAQLNFEALSPQTKQQLAEAGIDENKAKAAEKQVEGFASKAQKALGMLAGYFAVQGVTSFFNSTVEGMANVARVSGYLGISTNALSVQVDRNWKEIYIRLQVLLGLLGRN